MHEFPLDADAVIEAAIKHNIVLELNNSSLNPLSPRAESISEELDFALAACEAGALMSLNSDAHHANVVGTFEPGLTLAKERGIPEDYFINHGAQRVLDHILAKRHRPLIEDCA
jgi:putative hydrolase